MFAAPQQDDWHISVVEKAKAAPPATSIPPHSPTAPTFPSSHHPSHLEMMPHPPGAASAAQQPASPGFGGGVTEGGDGGGGLPDWCHDSGENLPVVYQHVLEAVSEWVFMVSVCVRLCQSVSLVLASTVYEALSVWVFLLCQYVLGYVRVSLLFWFHCVWGFVSVSLPVLSVCASLCQCESFLWVLCVWVC